MGFNPHFCTAISGLKWGGTPHFCSAIFWGPQPDDYQAKFSGHKTTISSNFRLFLVRFCNLYRCLQLLGLQFWDIKWAGVLKGGMLNLLDFKDPIFFMFIYFWERERKQGRSRERGRHRIRSRLQAELSAQNPMWGSNSQTTRSWPELKSDA